MAKTAKQKEWTPKRLRKAVTAGSNAEKVELLQEIGVLKSDGTLTERTEDWGNKPTRTPEIALENKRDPMVERPARRRSCR